MPYSPENTADVGKVKKKLLKTYSSVSDTAARQAIHVFNSVLDSSGDEGRAWASVYSKMNERLSKKASRSEIIRRAAQMPKGSPERRALLAALQNPLRMDPEEAMEMADEMFSEISKKVDNAVGLAEDAIRESELFIRQAKAALDRGNWKALLKLGMITKEQEDFLSEVHAMYSW